MTQREELPCVAAKEGASCCDRSHDCKPPCSCKVAPLCPRIRVSVGDIDGQAIELGWGADTDQGRLVGIHVHEADLEAFTVDMPLGLLLTLWRGPRVGVRTWCDQRTHVERSSHLEALGDDSILLKCRSPDAGILVPAILLRNFKEAIGLLVRLAAMTVGVRDANLTDAGGSTTTLPCCPLCTSERGCRTSMIGITLCIGSEEGAIARTQNGYFVHLQGHAATRVRIDGAAETNR